MMICLPIVITHRYGIPFNKGQAMSDCHGTWDDRCPPQDDWDPSSEPLPSSEPPSTPPHGQAVFCVRGQHACHLPGIYPRIPRI